MEERVSAGGFCIKATRSRGGNGGTGTKCGRWNPTAEQVKVLTDLFRSGLRTPTTDQIQRISTQLSFYGKIESKNVFYWFQNHKARERQKRRKVSVDLDQKDLVRHDRMININPSPIDFLDVNQETQPEKVRETLQLFPLNSKEDSKYDTRFHYASDQHYCRESVTAATVFSPYSCGTEIDHPPLDLRLSFL